jgi:hypothetical protein
MTHNLHNKSELLIDERNCKRENTGCIRLRFQRILKYFFMIKQSCSIQSGQLIFFPIHQNLLVFN